MEKTDETNANKDSENVQVLCRFTRDEIEAMRAETGASADATAVACFCRKNLRKL